MSSVALTAPATSDLWNAVVARNRKFDGAIFYGVSSTGIYCMPSCPSRRPKPENVRFFFAPEAAENAGFRACKRCNPGQKPPVNVHLQLVRSVCSAIERSVDSPPPLKQLAQELKLHPAKLQRDFRQRTGVTVKQYVAARQLSLFKTALRFNPDVTTAIYEAGYNSSSRIYENVTSKLGMTPAVYGKGGNGVRIRYSVCSYSGGKALLAVTEKGICSVKLGDNPAKLVQELQGEYARADVIQADGELADWTANLLRRLEGEIDLPELPVDVRTTAFQRRVYEELKRIAPGETRTYSEIAKTMGNESGRRAVARACATNEVAVLIPCHRVVRSDGGLGGYRWGLGRKHELLERERAAISGDNKQKAAKAAM
jgi:AraC family transcriptional regulator of adaptative response/methylated-DNA-[protein]-cysteine methyltransferase